MNYAVYYKTSKLMWQKIVKDRTGKDVTVLGGFRYDDFSDYGCTFVEQDTNLMGSYKYKANSIKWGW